MKTPKQNSMTGAAAREAFQLGRHREVVESVRYPGCDAEAAMALIGSLSFLGRLEDATALWSSAHADFDRDLRARARFTLALAYTRISRFKSARRWLKANLDDLETHDAPDTHQGLAVYHYYLGRFEKAARNAKRALSLSIEKGDDYIRAFATDLYGHALVQTGHRSAGVRRLLQARELSRSGSDPFTPARLIYEAEAGLRPLTIVRELEEQLASVLPEDTFTRTNLILELSRQLTLRGQWRPARELLDRESHAIYANENRRHEATLQLRLAEISFRQGDAAAATHFLRAARRCLNKIADSVYEIRIIGLEHKIERRLYGREPSAESLERLRQLSESHASPMNSRIRARTESDVKTARFDEDPLGDLMDRQNPEEVLNWGYLGLWPELRKLKAGDDHLCVRDSGEWIAVSRDGVFRSRQPLTSLSRRLLSRLTRGPANKDDLIKSAWGYDYDPLRHDSVIYAALGALRKALGEYSHWIRSHDEGWSFGASSYVDEAKVEMPKRPAPEAEAASGTDSLNWRQLRAVRDLTSRAMWTVPDYRKSFRVSTMTAWRDLDGLTKIGYLSRNGRGRSTVYLPKGSDL